MNWQLNPLCCAPWVIKTPWNQPVDWWQFFRRGYIDRLCLWPPASIIILGFVYRLDLNGWLDLTLTAIPSTATTRILVAFLSCSAPTHSVWLSRGKKFSLIAMQIYGNRIGRTPSSASSVWEARRLQLASLSFRRRTF